MRSSIARSALRAVSLPAQRAPIIARPILLAHPFSSTAPILKKAKGQQHPKSSKKKAQVADEDSEGGADGPVEVEIVVEEVIAKAKTKMDKSVRWAKAVIFEGAERVTGRVSPALLDSVRVKMVDGSTLHLNSLASVTTKGNSLFVEVWDTSSMKQVDSALHAANLPGISPLKISETTLKIPIARPTAEQRKELLKSLAQTVEAAKVQIRVARTEGMKTLGGKKAAGTDEVQKLVDDMCKELDGQLVLAKKEFEKV
ncbi:hypothetical protein IAT38_000611 [Cryptococcus sp. DSM 104549]